MLKILKIGIIFLLLSNCGYVPMYANQQDLDFNIKVKSLEGEKDINIILSQKLNRYQKENKNKSYDVEIISDYEKNSLTKDESGNTTNFRLILEIDFKINLNGIPETLNFKETFDMKKDATLFDESNYENTLKKEMTDLILQKFITQILTIQ
mgnify:FL=1|tara:strand:+ start:590 stop:1045 length:456 start_codon:yes stop_codon:yes gene_type:complete